MHDEYMEYQDNLRKYYRQQYALVFWCFLFACFVILTVVLVLIVIPVGIAFGVGCFFFLRFIIKKWKRCAETWRKIKEYRSGNRQSMILKKGATYCFVVPFSTLETLDIISSVLTTIGDVKRVDLEHGMLVGKLRISSKKKVPVVFYVERNHERCNVRACFSSQACDDWWDLFLRALFEKHPDADFGVSLAKGNPMIAGVLNLSGDTREVLYSKTTGGRSLGGFLVGGALFGDAGAIVGGLSGDKHTITNSRTVFSKELLVRLIFSNGRLWEGTVVKGSQLYNEIMVIAM